MSSDQNPAPSSNGSASQHAGPSAYVLRKRSGQMTDFPLNASSAGSGSHDGHQAYPQTAKEDMFSNASSSAPPAPPKTIATRRSDTNGGTLQSEFSLSLASLAPPSPPRPSLPFPARSATATPSASSPLTTPFAKQRAADEIQAVAEMLSKKQSSIPDDASRSTGIQRPASAPPRARRVRRRTTNDDGKAEYDNDDAGVDAIEKASKDQAATTSISEIATETIEMFAGHLSDRALAVLFMFILAWGAVLSLDRLTTYSYQTIVVNSFSHHSSLAEVSVIRSVVAAIAAVPFATIADLGGRAQAFTAGLVLYAAGHATMAGSTTVQAYIGGVVMYELGANGLVCLQNTVLADMTSSRNRLFFQILPQMPFLVFSFISSDIYSAILPRWRWGIGMFAVLGPATLLPVIFILSQQQPMRKDQKSQAISSLQSARRASLQQSASGFSYVRLMIVHTWQAADLCGLLLLGASLSLTLVPLSMAASAPDHWRDPKILGMISGGLVLLAIFAYWEVRQASNPVVPKALLRNRSFWGGAWTLCLLNTAHSLMLTYYPTYLYVVHGVSNRAQQNFSVVYSFTVAAASLPIALVVRYVRRTKVFIIFGVLVFTSGFGMMISYRGTTDSEWIIASSQVLLGLGGALTIAITQAAVQVGVSPSIVAPTIAVLGIFPMVGNAAGAAVAGAMWSGLLPGKLAQNLVVIGHLNDLASIYAEPLTWIESYALGSSTRTAVVTAYNSCWRTMMIASTLICAASFAFVVLMANNRLGEALSADDAAVLSKEERQMADDWQIQSTSLSASYAGDVLQTREKLFGDRMFEHIEDAVGGKLIRRAPKKSHAGHSPAHGLERKDYLRKWSRWPSFPNRTSGRVAQSKDATGAAIPTTLTEVAEDDKAPCTPPNPTFPPLGHGVCDGDPMQIVPPILVVDQVTVDEDEAENAAYASLTMPNSARPSTSRPLSPFHSPHSSLSDSHSHSLHSH